MPTYRILYTAVEYREINIDAEDEAEARRIFHADIEERFPDCSILDDTGDYDIETVDEVTA